MTATARRSFAARDPIAHHTSATTTLPFTPFWLGGQPGAPLIHLRAAAD